MTKKEIYEALKDEEQCPADFEWMLDAQSLQEVTLFRTIDMLFDVMKEHMLCEASLGQSLCKYDMRNGYYPPWRSGHSRLPFFEGYKTYVSEWRPEYADIPTPLQKGDFRWELDLINRGVSRHSDNSSYDFGKTGGMQRLCSLLVQMSLCFYRTKSGRGGGEGASTLLEEAYGLVRDFIFDLEYIGEVISITRLETEGVADYVQALEEEASLLSQMLQDGNTGDIYPEMGLGVMDDE